MSIHPSTYAEYCTKVVYTVHTDRLYPKNHWTRSLCHPKKRSRGVFIYTIQKFSMGFIPDLFLKDIS